MRKRGGVDKRILLSLHDSLECLTIRTLKPSLGRSLIDREGRVLYKY